MDVIARRLEITVAAAIYDQGLVSSAEEVAEQFMPAIEPAGIRAQEPFHADDQIGPGRFEHQMKMIEHETKRGHLPIGLGARFTECFQKTDAVMVVVEDWFATIAAIHYVVEGPR